MSEDKNARTRCTSDEAMDNVRVANIVRPGTIAFMSELLKRVRASVSMKQRSASTLSSACTIASRAGQVLI